MKANAWEVSGDSVNGHEYVLGLGANLGSRQASLAAALDLIAARDDCRLAGVSALYQSEPVGPPQPHYLNAAARVHSALGPRALLAVLLEIEHALGRRRAERWGPRVIDLDLLWAGTPFADVVLQVPHPRLGERWFALLPLLEVAPELQPRYGAALRALQARCPELGAGTPRPFVGPGWTLGPRVQVRGDTQGLELHAQAADRAEALAAVLGALGARLWPDFACGAIDAPVLLCAPADAAPAALARETLARAARGFAFARACVATLGPERSELRLLGRQLACGGACWSLLEASEAACGEGYAVGLRLVREPLEGR